MCLLGYKKEEGWVKNGPKNKQTNQETVAKVVRSCRRSREAKVDVHTWLQLGQCSLLADSCILLINVLCKVFNPSRGDCSRQVGARSCRSVNNVRKHIDVQFRGDKTEIVSVCVCLERRLHPKHIHLPGGGGLFSCMFGHDNMQMI